MEGGGYPLPVLGYIYEIARPHREEALADAEFAALTGMPVTAPAPVLPFAADIARSAYVRSCVRIEVAAQSLEELVAGIRQARLHYEGFRVRVVRPAPRVKVDSAYVEREVGFVVNGRPRLKNPAVEVAVVVTQHGWYCGKLVSRGQNRWVEGKKKPWNFSSALPQRLARAVVNLVAAPGDLLIDPCCGMGTVVAEALQMGVVAAGCDTNGRLLAFARRNMQAHNLPSRLFCADARTLSGNFDAAVVDLPYGMHLKLDWDVCLQILHVTRSIAKRAAIITAKPLETILRDEIGYAVGAVITIKKGNMTRYIHLVSSCETA